VLAKGSAKATRTGRLTVKLKPTAAGRRALRRSRTLKVTIRVTFRPAGGGKALTKKRTARLRR